MRRFFIASLAVLGSLAASAALAWACTPQAELVVGSASGRPGDTVTVTGRGFLRNWQIPLHLTQGGAEDGQLLATATSSDQGTFTVNVTIPALSPANNYYVTGVAHGPNGGTASMRFSVEAPAAPAPAATNSAPATSNAVGAPTAPKRTAKAPSHAPAHGRSSPGRHTQPAASKRTPVTSHSGGSRSVGSGSRRGVAGGTGRQAALAPVPSRSAVARGKSGQAVFADSLPPVPSEASAPAKSGASFSGWHPFSRWHIPSLVGGPAGVRAGTGNLGSGFGQGTHPPSKATAGGSGPQLAIGAGVLGLGLVLLFGGFAVAEVRRRRVPAGLRSVTTHDREDREADRSTA